MHLFTVWRKQIFVLEKAVSISIFYHLFVLMFIYIKRIAIKNYIYKTPVIIWQCHILCSENYHQLFKHWLLKLSNISWLHVLNVLFSIQYLKEHLIVYFIIPESHNALFNLT